MFKLVCTYITQLKEYDIICLCHDDNLLFRIREFIWIKCKPELHLHNLQKWLISKINLINKPERDSIDIARLEICANLSHVKYYDIEGTQRPNGQHHQPALDSYKAFLKK